MTYDMAFDKLVCHIDWINLVIWLVAICQSKWIRDGANHQCSDSQHIQFTIVQPPCPYTIYTMYTYMLLLWGWGNNTVISVSVYQAGVPGSRPPRSLVLERWNSITVL